MRMGIGYKKHNIGLRIGVILFLSLVFLLFIMKRLEPAFTAQLSFYANDMVTENVHKAVYEVFDEHEFGDLAEIINNHCFRNRQYKIKQSKVTDHIKS